MPLLRKINSSSRKIIFQRTKPIYLHFNYEFPHCYPIFILSIQRSFEKILLQFPVFISYKKNNIHRKSCCMLGMCAEIMSQNIPAADFHVIFGQLTNLNWIFYVYKEYCFFLWISRVVRVGAWLKRANVYYSSPFHQINAFNERI